MEEIEIEPGTKGITIDDTVRTRYGPKHVLGGDTYGILSSKGDDLSSEIDWDLAHCTWDSNREAWMIDADEEARNELERVLERNGYELGGWVAELTGLLKEHARSEHDDDEEWSPWESHEIEIEVEYESKQSGNLMTKEGVVYAVAFDEHKVMFRRDDGHVNKIKNDGLFSSGRYPYMGDIKRVTVRVPSDDADGGECDVPEHAEIRDALIDGCACVEG